MCGGVCASSEVGYCRSVCDGLSGEAPVPQILSSCPRVLMDEIAKQLRRRCAWLAAEEQREYKVWRFNERITACYFLSWMKV